MLIIKHFLMRIFSVLLSFIAILELLFPQTVIATQKINTENTKNKNKIETKKIIKIPYNYPNYKPLKILSEDEITRNLILARRVRGNQSKYQNYYSTKNRKKIFIANLSAYTASADECGKSDGITASGVKVKEKRTLACPPQYVFGTKIKIKGMGVYVCEDRGGAIKGNRFDIYMKTKKQAFSFGRRYLEVQIIS